MVFCKAASHIDNGLQIYHLRFEEHHVPIQTQMINSQSDKHANTIVVYVLFFF